MLGLHLAVCDVSYYNYQELLACSEDKNKVKSDEEDHSSPPFLCGNVYDLVNKIRTVVRFSENHR